MADVNQEFEDWLLNQLNSYQIDSETYLSYIIEILKDEDEEDSVAELVQETLAGATDQDVTGFSEEIMTKWEKLNNNVDSSNNSGDKESTLDLNNLLNTHLSLAQKQTTEKKEIKLSEEQRRVKQSVMALYSSMQAEDCCEDDNEDGEGNDKDEDDALFHNTNAQAVASAEKNDRSRRKEEAFKKKEKDKLDLESQKLKKIERKEKEKKRTQKRERAGK